jgi:predicted amidohydrolase YtcJ
VLALRGEHTRLIDLKGAFVAPGFNDSHVHFASAASFFWNLQLMDVHSDETFVARVKDYVAAHPGEPIRGGGWGAYEQWEMGASQSGLKKEFWRPDRKLIDAIAGSTPMFISKFDDSLYFANTAALKRAGLDERAADTENTELNRGPFTEMMIKADAADIQVTVHAIGDEALGVMLDMIEAMTSANGPRDRRMRLVHAQVFAPRDFDRLKGLGVVAEVQPFHLSDDMRWMEQRIGYERCKGAYAFKTIQSKGATLSFGTDWPGTSASIYPISPIYGLYAAVTRQTVRRAPAEGWFPAERLTIEEAIKAYTWGSAYASFEEKIKGTLTEGKLADITVLDTNLARAKPVDWIDERGELMVKTLYTIVGGRVVYRR